LASSELPARSFQNGLSPLPAKDELLLSVLENFAFSSVSDKMRAPISLRISVSDLALASHLLLNVAEPDRPMLAAAAPPK